MTLLRQRGSSDRYSKALTGWRPDRRAPDGRDPETPLRRGACTRNASDGKSR
jgi:hypothetical protein